MQPSKRGTNKLQGRTSKYERIIMKEYTIRWKLLHFLSHQWSLYDRFSNDRTSTGAPIVTIRAAGVFSFAQSVQTKAPNITQTVENRYSCCDVRITMIRCVLNTEDSIIFLGIQA